uniref:UTP--glucose-1-phosphate uridylyltransferase n=1 Tax=Brugia malayi TaxID=6279 RepID=A0A0I9R2X5_BRUMA|nr:Bm9531 [Brugia malayi]
MNQCWSNEAQKLSRNVGEQFKQAFVNNERTQFDAEVFLSLFDQYLREPSTIDWTRMKPLSSKFQRNYESLPHCSGNELDKVVKHLSVIKLNGGLGTTMGCDGPKSLIEVRKGLTFLDFAIGHVQYFNKRNNSSVPLVLMNSFNTEKAVCEYLADRKVNLKTFLQSKCPRIFVENSMPGRDICFISNIDNTGATIDLRIAKLMVESDLEYIMECTEKTKVDRKGGTLIEINGYIMHLEMPQVPKDHINDFCSTDIFKIFNTNNIWVNLRAVKKKLAEMKMEIIVNRKILSTGEFVIQLETSVGGTIRNFDKVLSIQVPRSRFLPVKNTQDLLAIMSDLYEVREDFSLQFVRKGKVPVIELSKYFSKVSEFQKRFREIPQLRQLKRLKVEGDVYFGHRVVLKDNVEIAADQGQQLEVAEGECLENIKLIQKAHYEVQRIPLDH